MPNTRTCVVSYRDTEGMELSVEVSAGSLYEAAALGLKAFRESTLTGARPGPATPLRVTVRADADLTMRNGFSGATTKSHAEVLFHSTSSIECAMNYLSLKIR